MGSVFHLIIVLMILLPTNISMSSILRLYHSFAEIHQEYTGPHRFRHSEWINIKHDSILLRSSSKQHINETLTVERRIVRVDTNSEKRIFVRRYPKHNNPIPCEIINTGAITTLVRDIQTGYYFHTQNHLIEYSTEPQSEPIYEVSFNPIPSNHTYMISYIVTNLRWQNRYTLQTYLNSSTHFQILVDIINSSPFTSQFNQTYVMLGDINLILNPIKSASLTLPIASKLDYSGTYSFTSINQSINIDSHAILTLPVHSPNIHVKTMYSYTLVLPTSSLFSDDLVSIDSNQQKFHRLYQLSNSSIFLPTGYLFLTDSSSNMFTGEWYLPSLARNEKYEFQLGEDLDVMLTYNRTINRNPKTNSSLSTIRVLIQNYKAKKVHLIFKSICEYSAICFYYNDKAHSLGSHLRYEFFLQPKSEVTFSFTTVRMF